MSLSVAVAGASGYAGGEALRLIAAHPELDVVTVTAHSNVGQPLIAVHPHLRSLAGLSFVPTTVEGLAGHDVVVLALPHGQSAEIAAALPDDVLVVDLGADHRLEREEDWQRVYGDGFVPAWPYGMPELPVGDGLQRRRLRGAKRIAVPGCNVTAVTLALAPGVTAGVVDTTDVVAVLAVGPSGAGRAAKPHLMASEMLGSAAAYAVGGTHRHIPEIQQNLRSAGASEVRISFTPVLIPASRGILATVTAPLAGGVGRDEVDSAWRAAYDDERFVHVLPRGEFPSIGDVIGSNAALVGVTVDEDAGRVVAICAIDNLGKGTAGAAVQSMNIALGLEESLGLTVDGVAP